MEDGHGLKGKVVLPPAGQMHLPPRMHLAGNMFIDIQVDGEEKIRLRSRKEAAQSGDVTGWPPYTMQIELENGPIEYYHEKDLNDPNAEPVLVVTSNTVTFGDREALGLAVKPEILSADIVEASGAAWQSGPIGGVALTWTDTSPIVDPDGPPVHSYHVYRNFTPNDLAGWKKIASVPREKQEYLDTGFKGGKAAYLVLQTVQYAFEYHYEGHFGIPTIVEARGGKA